MSRPHAYVCVPARNEALLLEGLFAALTGQTETSSWSLCLLLDGCSDRSLKVAEELRGCAKFPVAIRSVASSSPNAGRARAAAMRMATDHHGGDGAAIYLTTDADSAPAPDWIARSRLALAGCDLATGRITRANGSPVQDQVEAYYDRLYALRRRFDPVGWDPGPHHHFTGGANMAFRSDAYAHLGGFADQVSGEDALIVDEAQRAGMRVRRDARMLVATSSRRSGRAPDGLAAALQAEASAERVRVAHPEAMAWQYAAHALARSFYDVRGAAHAAELGHRLSLEVEQLAREAERCANAESFATRIVPAPPDRRTVPLPEAEAALARLERTALEAAA